MPRKLLNKKTLFAILSSVLFLGCTLRDPLPIDYYSGTDKIAGGQAPTVPQLSYDPNERRFTFTAAIDPDTGAEVGEYIIYFYQGVPTRYYETRYIEAIIPRGQPRSFTINAPPGIYTVVVTGFDGYRESAVTEQNRITFTLP
ncbi:MAG: hypothetical protein N2Z22_06195 [Turneriella sp.]|nr:hypothetical protein [Turneriella sp.]